MPWPARAFLPGTSMLIKRVAWLKRKGQKVEKSLSRKGRWTLAVLMAVVALGVAGIRGPNSAGEARNSAVAADATQSAPENGSRTTITADSITADPTTLLAQGDVAITATTANKKQLRTFQYVPADAKLVVAASPSELAKFPAVAKLFAAADEATRSKFGLTPSGIEDVQLIKIAATPPVNKFGGPDFERIVIRAAKPHDWKKMLLGFGDSKALAMMPKQFEGKEYYATDPDHPACFVPDDRTLIIGSEEEIQKIIKGGEKSMDAEQFPEFRSEPLAARVEASLVKELSGLGRPGKQFESAPAAAMLLPLLEHVKLARLAAWPKGQDGLDALLVLQCDDTQSPSDVAKTLDAGRTLLLNVLKAKQQAWGQTSAPPVPQETIVQANALFEAVIRSLSDAKLGLLRDCATVSAHVELGPPVLAGFALPAIAASREAAMRNESLINMKKLALALHIYASAQRHFPPAALRDKDGKPLLSWRVAILPYMEEGGLQLYQQFHLDEPWDSEHNKALLAKMPAPFRDPHEDDKSTSSSYFMAVGKGMFGDSDQGRQFKEITDGTSKTIMLIEAKRDIPWTKPEDIEIDADPAKPLPKFGGHMTNGFAAAIADGSVRFISDSADPQELHKFFTVAGGEVADETKLNPPASATPPPQKPDARPPQSSNEAQRFNIAISLDANGKVVIDLNGSRISEEELRKKLADLPSGDARKAIEASISADKETPYNDVVHVMDILNQAGIQKVSLPPKPDAPPQGAQGPPPRQYSEVDSSLREAPPMGPWQLVTEALPNGRALGLDEDSREIREIRNLAFRLRDEEDAIERELKIAEPDQAKREALRSQRLKELDEKSRAELHKILTADQYTRLNQAYLRSRGPDVFAEPEVEQALGIDAQQKEKLAAAREQQMKNYPFERGQIKDGMTIEQATKKSHDLATERQKTIDETLTAQQKAKLEEMRGKPPETAPQAARPSPGYPQWLIPEGHAKIEFRFAKYRPGEGLRRVELQRPIGIKTMVDLDEQPAMTGEDVAKVTVVPSTATKRDGSPSDYFAIDIAFSEAAAEKMAKLGKEKADEQAADHKTAFLAILVDGKVVSASPLPLRATDLARITGNFTKGQAEQLAKAIRTD
jgi:biopolymer transport protein ExbD